MASVHSYVPVSLTNKFSLLDETDPFRESSPSTQPPATVDDRFNPDSFVNTADDHPRHSPAMMNTFATTILRESDDTIDTDSWHVKESRKKKSARGGENHVSGDDATSTSATPHRTNVTEPWDEDDEDAYYYSHAYGDDDDFDSETQSSFYSGGSESITKAISPSTITFITPTHEHELSKSSRAVNRKNIRLATKHQRNVKTIRTNQKTRAENLENRERRKNPHVPGLCSHSN